MQVAEIHIWFRWLWRFDPVKIRLKPPGWTQNSIRVCLVASLRIDEVFVQESNNRCHCACEAAAGGERPALRVSRFETDTGELLFSGLTPNLPLMDRPPNSRLLQAHSGAAHSEGCLPVSPFRGGNVSAECLSNTLSESPSQSEAMFLKQRHDSNGYHWSARRALQA